HEGHVGRGECQVVQDPHIVQGDVGRGGRHLYEIAELLADRRAAPGGHLGQGSWRLDHQRGGVSSRTEEDRTVNVRVVTGAGPRLAVGVGAGEVRLVGDNSAVREIQPQGSIEIDLDLGIGSCSSRQSQAGDGNGARNPADRRGDSKVGNRRHSRGEVVGDGDAVHRRPGKVLEEQGVVQPVARKSRGGRVAAGGQVPDRLLEVIAGQGRRNAVDVLEIQGAGRAVGDRPVVLATAGKARFGAEPPGGAGNVGEGRSGYNAGAVRLGLVGGDQTLGGGDPGRIEHGQGKLTGRTAAAVPGELVVCAVHQRSRDRGDAVGRKDPGGNRGDG